MERFFWVCLAGAAGTGARYLVGVWTAERFGVSFPYGTLIVNVVGCFLIALVMHLALSTAAFPPNLRFALATGFIGGLTTYSSFNYETTALLEAGASRAAALYAAATIAGAFAAGWLGTMVARLLLGR